MKQAKANEKRIDLETIRWTVVPTALQHRQGKDYTEEAIQRMFEDTKQEPKVRSNHARYLAWLARCKQGHKIDITALHLGPVHLVHMPGELFVEYQIGALKERANEIVAMAAYGDYGPMYIGTAKAYEEGGYETSQVSRVGPEAEEVLRTAIRKVLAG